MISPGTPTSYSNVSLPRSGRKQRKHQQLHFHQQQQTQHQDQRKSFHQLSFGEQDLVDECQRMQIQNQGNERTEEMTEQQQHSGGSSKLEQSTAAEDRKQVDANLRVRKNLNS